MNNNYILGNDPQTNLGDSPRFFYGLRKNENGSVFLQRIDQIRDKDTVSINNPGEPEGNYNDFEVGVDFFEGIDVNHNTVFENLSYQQYKWDSKPIFYYVDEDGQLVAKVNAGHTYNDNDSED